VTPGRCPKAGLLFQFALCGELRLLRDAVMQVKRSSRHLKEELPHWSAELAHKEHLARWGNGRITGGINGEDSNGTRMTNDVPHVLIAAGALHRRSSPLHVRRLHHEVRSDDNLVEFARLKQRVEARTKSVITKSHAVPPI